MRGFAEAVATELEWHSVLYQNHDELADWYDFVDINAVRGRSIADAYSLFTLKKTEYEELTWFMYIIFEAYPDRNCNEDWIGLEFLITRPHTIFDSDDDEAYLYFNNSSSELED